MQHFIHTFLRLRVFIEQEKTKTHKQILQRATDLRMNLERNMQ